MQSFGITAAPYKRPPAGKDTFLISILPKRPEGVIQVNQGLAKVEIHGSKVNRQAVITVAEQPRVIKRTVKTSTATTEAPTIHRAKEILRWDFPVSIPGNVSWTYASVKVSKRSRPGQIDWDVSGVVTARAGSRTVSHFLLGVDESYNFIAPLKEKPSSVEHAYRILKPDLRAGSLRQGEWFFEPLVKAESDRIEKIAQADSRKVKPFVLGGSTHRAHSSLAVITPGKGIGKKRKFTRTLYARGYVVDNRKGHHTALFLPSWHRVVRNNEIVYKRAKNAPRRRASFD